MDASQSIQRFCNADKGNGRGKCKRRAGWGTPYTTGPCINHGGALPNVRKHHARKAAQLYVGQMGARVECDPIEAPIIALEIAHGIVLAWQQRIADCDGRSDERMDEGLKAANMDFARIGKIALDAGLAERQTRVVERLSEPLSLIFEEMAAAAELTPAQRVRMLAAFTSALHRLEQPVIESTAIDVAA